MSAAVETRSTLPWQLGAGLRVVFYFAFWWLFYFAFERWVLGASVPRTIWDNGGAWETGVRALLFGYTPVISLLSVRGSLRDLCDLEPILNESTSLEALRHEIENVESRTRLLAISVLGAVFLAFWGPAELDQGISRITLGDPYVVWSLVWFAIFGWVLSRAVWLEFRIARRFSRLGEDSIRIDLLDMTPLAPLTRRGLRSVLLWVIWFSILALFWVGPRPWNPANAWGLVPLFAIALVALVVPVSGVHRKIRALKGEELAGLNDAIRNERAELGDLTRRSADAHLANLIAYRTLIEAVREWPLDLRIWARFSLYLLLGLGSWLGAALVERLLETVLN